MEVYLIAVDFHCKYQKVAWLNPETGETGHKNLSHERKEEVKEFYQQFPKGSVVALEASGYSWWFERLIEGLGHQLRVGHPTYIARMRLRRQKNDQVDTDHILALLARKEFPEIWRGTVWQREQKMVIRHRVKLVRERTRWINRLRALASNFNLVIKRGNLSQASRAKIGQLEMGVELEALRDEMLDRIEALDEKVSRLDEKIKLWCEVDADARRVETIPGIGPITALYLVRVLGPIERFSRLKQVAAYLGLDTLEHSSNNLFVPRCYGSISRQGERVLRWLLVQCAQSAARHNPQLRRFYLRLLHRRGRSVAKVAVARKLLVYAAVMLRDQIDYEEFLRRGSVRDLPARNHGL